MYIRKYGRNHKKSLQFVIVIHIVLRSNHQAYYAKITQRFALCNTEHFSSVIYIANMSRATIFFFEFELKIISNTCVIQAQNRVCKNELTKYQL